MKNRHRKQETHYLLSHDDNEINYEELKFKDLIDVSFVKMNFYRTSKYFSQINCHLGPPSIIYYIHIVLTVMQLISPCFLLNSTIIWKENSLVSFIFQIIFTISRGWHSGEEDLARIIITISSIFLIIVFNILLAILKHRFQRRQIISDTESKIVISIYKYILPHFYPFLLCGFPGSIKNLTNGQHTFLNYFDVIFGPILFIYEIFKYTILVKRVLFEKNPSFSLNSICLPFTVCFISLNNLIDCAIVPPEKSSFRIFLVALLFVFYLAMGVIHSYFVLYISKYFSFIFSSFCLSCSVTSLICLVCIIAEIHLSFYIFIIFIVLTLIFYFLNLALNNYSFIKCLQKFDEISLYPENEEEIFNSLFKNKYKFLRTVYMCFAYFDPYIFSPNPFQFAYDKWPESATILILWAKIMSIFPKKQSTFEMLTVQIINNPDISFTYQLQFKYLSHTRITYLNRATKTFILSFNKSSVHIKNMTKLFFENIASKNTLSFWKSVADIQNEIEVLDFSIRRLVSEYPNNYYLIKTYITFLENYKNDPNEIIEWKNKLKIFETSEKLISDLPFSAALQVYPQLADFCEQTVDYDQNESTRPIVSEDENEDEKLKTSLSMMIKSSKVGIYVIPFIFIIIGTILVVVGFIAFLVLYRNKFVDFYYKVCTDLNNIYNIILSCSKFELFLSQLATKNANLVNRTEVFLSLAPSLVNDRNSLIPKWTFDIDDVIKVGLETSELFENLEKYFLNFDMNIDQVYESYMSIFDEETSTYLPTKNSINNVVEMLKNSPSDFVGNDQICSEFISNASEFIPKLTDATQQLVDSLPLTNTRTLKIMNNLMALSLLFDLVFISVPFVFYFFYLGLIGNDITQSFLTLQISSVHDVIVKLKTSETEFDLNSSISQKNNENSNMNIVLPTQKNYELKRTALIYMTLFILTFVPICAPFFVIYFLLQFLETKELDQIIAYRDIAFPITLVYHMAFTYTEIYNNKFVYKTDDKIDIYKENGQKCIEEMNNILKAGLFGSSESLKIINKFSPPDTRIISNQNLVLTELESLVRMKYISSISMLNSIFVFEFYNIDTMELEDIRFYEISYYFTNWAIEYRDKPFFSSIFKSIKNGIKYHFSYVIPLSILVTILQVIVVIFVINYLLSNLQYFQSALQLFLYFKPDQIMLNDSIMKIIYHYGLKGNDDQISFCHSDVILTSIPEAIIIMNKKLTIIDHNKSLNKMISTDESLVGKQLGDVLHYAKSNGYNEDNLERKLNKILKGKEEPNIEINFSILTSDRKKLCLKANVISLSQKGSISNESQYKEISMIALVLNDANSNKYYIDQIKNEEAQISKFLVKVIPAPIVDEINNSNDSVSFNVKNMTIGKIYLETTPFAPDEGIQAPFKFYNEIFDMFDDCLKSCPSVIQTKKFLKYYSFSSGLFDDQMKPEKMADQALKFAVNVIQLQNQIEEKFKRRISISIGIDIGGPVVAGFVSLNRPNFWIIGEVNEMAQFLVLTGIPGKIHISENMNKLISSLNYNVKERGEITLSNNQRQKTFLIAP